jgi:hypothetical protein
VTAPNGQTRTETLPTTGQSLNYNSQQANTTFTVSASIARQCSGSIPARTVNSKTNNGGFVVTLRNGDPVPNRPAFGDNATTLDQILGPYITGTGANRRMNLAANQVIFLFELFTTNNTTAYDLQDSVVLATVTEK